MKKFASPVPVVLLLAAAVAVIGILTWFIQSRIPSKEHLSTADYFGITSADEVGVISGMRKAPDLAKKTDGIVYLDYDTVASYVNKRFYWDQDENVLCVTTPTKLVTVDLGSADGKKEAYVSDGVLWISADFLQTVTDMEMQSFSDPSYLFITTRWDEKTASLAKDAAVRSSDNIKAPIIHDGTKGEKVRIVPASVDKKDDTAAADGWQHVETADGLIGYIETASITQSADSTDAHVSKIGEYTSLTMDRQVNMAFHQTDNPDSNATITDKLAHATGVNVVSPTWFFINGAGSVTSIADADYVQKLHDKGIKVWALINDFDGRMNSKDDTYAALKSTSSRTAIIRTIMEEAQKTGIDGLNIDIENVNENCAPAYLEFMRELSVQCRNDGLVLSTDTYVPMDYSAYLDRAEQGTVCDYVVVMCYDEHYKGSEKAGSVSSLSWVQDGIDRMKEEVPADKVIAAIPFYTRLWNTTDNGAPSSELMDMAEAAKYVSEHKMQESWDKETSQNYAELQADDGFYQIWLEDADSITAKMKAIQAAGIAGVAQWRLGNETDGIYAIIAKYLQ